MNGIFFPAPDSIHWYGKRAAVGTPGPVRTLVYPGRIGCDDPGDYVLHLLPVHGDLCDGANV